MGERLDAAAILSARTVRAVAKTPFARQFRENVLFVRRVVGAGAAAALTEATTEGQQPGAASTRGPVEQSAHPGLTRQPADEFVQGDDERCTCRGAGATSCHATKGDVVHDLMSNGMQLDRSRAEAIWRDAQNARLENVEHG